MWRPHRSQWNAAAPNTVRPPRTHPYAVDSVSRHGAVTNTGVRQASVWKRKKEPMRKRDQPPARVRGNGKKHDDNLTAARDSSRDSQKEETELSQPRNEAIGPNESNKPRRDGASSTAQSSTSMMPQGQLHAAAHMDNPAPSRILPAQNLGQAAVTTPDTPANHPTVGSNWPKCNACAGPCLFCFFTNAPDALHGLGTGARMGQGSRERPPISGTALDNAMHDHGVRGREDYGHGWHEQSTVAGLVSPAVDHGYNAGQVLHRSGADTNSTAGNASAFHPSNIPAPRFLSHLPNVAPSMEATTGVESARTGPFGSSLASAYYGTGLSAFASPVSYCNSSQLYTGLGGLPTKTELSGSQAATRSWAAAAAELADDTRPVRSGSSTRGLLSQTERSGFKPATCLGASSAAESTDNTDTARLPSLTPPVLAKGVEFPSATRPASAPAQMENTIPTPSPPSSPYLP